LGTTQNVDVITKKVFYFIRFWLYYLWGRFCIYSKQKQGRKSFASIHLSKKKQQRQECVKL